MFCCHQRDGFAAQPITTNHHLHIPFLVLPPLSGLYLFHSIHIDNNNMNGWGVLQFHVNVLENLTRQREHNEEKQKAINEQLRALIRRELPPSAVSSPEIRLLVIELEKLSRQRKRIEAEQFDLNQDLRELTREESSSEASSGGEPEAEDPPLPKRHRKLTTRKHFPPNQRVLGHRPSQTSDGLPPI
jgi:hypothetical protein